MELLRRLLMMISSISLSCLSLLLLLMVLHHVLVLLNVLLVLLRIHRLAGLELLWQGLVLRYVLERHSGVHLGIAGARIDLLGKLGLRGLLRLVLLKVLLQF